ncbi:MAG: inorganic phosphate transporter, partial [Actinobacteria bacterium]|nr:inorganic phosphate transporter [Actinomycetota bacterium]
LLRLRRCAGDPHPGNYLLLADGRIGFLDFGLMRVVPAGYLDGERRVARAVIEDDAATVHRLMGELGYLPDPDGFEPEALLGQIASASLLSLSHGTNDAQKTMGIITLALVAHGSLEGTSPTPPTWVIVSAATAIALGTYSGGWRIIRTMGTRIYKMDPAQGFAAQGGGAAVLLTASHLGFPLSTTHSITGAVLGAGAAKRLSAVRWGLAGNIAVAWVLTLPAAAAVGAITYGVSRIFGDGALGPLLIAVSLVMLIAAMFGKRLRQGPPIAAPAPGEA